MGNTKATQAIVVAIKDIYNFNMGCDVPSEFKVGDRVLFPSMGSQKITIDRVDYFICGVQDILGAVEEVEE